MLKINILLVLINCSHTIYVYNMSTYIDKVNE